MLCGIFVNAQNYQLIEKMRGTSLTDAKTLATEIVNSSNVKYEFVKDKTIQETGDYLVVFIPSGLTEQQKKELASNNYEEGIVVQFSKTPSGNYKMLEFYTDPDLMFSIVKKVFHPEASNNDFIELAKFRDFVNKDKKLKIYFYSEDEKFRFYNYSEQL